MAASEAGSRAADSVSSSSVRGLLVVWFSKDRALQLSEAWRTFARFAEPSRDGHIRHVVLYAYSSPAHARSYASLASALPQVAFIDELCEPRPAPNHAQLHHTADATRLSKTAQQSYFADHLRAIVDSSPEEFVLLCVDDALFIASFSLSHILHLFASSSLLAYHLTLHPGLTFHQPSSSSLTLPTFTSPTQQQHTVPAGRSSSQPPPLSLLFSHSLGSGSHDFRYPFSLASSLYRLVDVRCIVHDLSCSSGRSLPYHHPNLFESSGNALISTRSSIPAAVRAFLPPPSPSDSSALSTLRPLSALPSRPVCVVVTVNRVQAVYGNAVFESADGGVDAMLQRFEAGGWQLDEDRYGEMAAHGHFTSVHVGELLWKPREADDDAAAGVVSR